MDLVTLRKELKAYRDGIARFDAVLSQIAKLKADPESHIRKLISCTARAQHDLESLGMAKGLEDRLRAWLGEYSSELSNIDNHQKRKFGTELANELKAHGLQLSGQLPDLECGFLRICPDLEAGHVTIWFGPEQERLTRCGPKPGTVVDAVIQIRKALGSGLPPERFLQLLERAVVRCGAGPDDKPRSLTEVLGEMAFLLQKPAFRQNPSREHYTSYTRADFGYDLYRMNRSDAGSQFLNRFTLSVSTRATTKSRSGFIWVPKSDSCRGVTCSDIQLKGSSS